jgi:hypothetical protein
MACARGIGCKSRSGVPIAAALSSTMDRVKLRGHARDDRLFCSLMLTADRMRARAWDGYLEATRDADDYDHVEPDAWRALQERLSAIDHELMNALAAAV